MKAILTLPSNHQVWFAKLTELFKFSIGVHQDVTNVLHGPGIQLAESYFQQHPVERGDQVHILQAIRQRVPFGQGGMLLRILLSLCLQQDEALFSKLPKIFFVCLVDLGKAVWFWGHTQHARG